MPARQPVHAMSVCAAAGPHRRAVRRTPLLAAAAPPAPAALPGAKKLQDLTAVERAVDVAVSATSSLLNGAIFGAFFGLVSGAWSTRSGAGALAEARANGQSWGGISGIYAGLQTLARVVRNTDDRWNNVLGACGSGAAFSIKQGPRAAAQGCVSFAGLSYLIDVFTSPKDASDDLDASSEKYLSDEAILRKKR
jgi:hypothetical protein